MGEILENPASITEILATSLPLQTGFFMSLVMVYSFSGMSIGLLHIGHIVRILLEKLIGTTKRKARAPRERNLMDTTHVKYARHSLVLLLCTVYSVLNPLIAPFGAIYFALCYLTDRVNFIYVYTIARSDHGAIFPTVFSRMIWIIITFQFVIAAIIGLAEFIASAAIIVPFVVVASFGWWAHRSMHAMGKYGILSQPEDAEPLFDDLERNDFLEKYPAADTYKHPLLRRPFLFQKEDQHSEEVYETAYWWPLEWQERGNPHGSVKMTSPPVFKEESDMH